MFNFQIITLFPEAIRPYLDESILGRAQKAKKIKIGYFSPRDFTLDKHRKVDNKPYGGGPGMVMTVEPILRAVSKAKSELKDEKSKIIIFSPGGKQFTNELSAKWAKNYNNLIMIAGHYEGIDARVKKILKAEEISIGPYVLTGGEVPSLVVVDAVARQIPGVLGNLESPEEKRVSSSEVYSRPEVYVYQGKKYTVPKVLLSGHRAEIEKWKQKTKAKK